MLTFNTGWDENAQKVEVFDNVRAIQKKITNNGVQIDNPVEKDSSCALTFMIQDPDGNLILSDQHV